MKISNYIGNINLLVCIICFLLSFAFASCYYYNLQTKYAGNEVEKNPQDFLNKKFGNFLVKEEPLQLLIPAKQSFLETSSTDTSQIRELIKGIYSNRETAYRSSADGLITVLYMLMVLVVIGLFILFYKPKELEVPLINITIPDKLFYVVIPIVIVYLFFQLGLKMSAAIDSRLVLESMTDSIETIGSQRVSYYHSNARTFVDQGLVDAWCTWYYNIFQGGRNPGLHQWNAFGLLFCFFGTFVGLTQAACLNLISAYHAAYKNRILSITLVIVAYISFVMWSFSLAAWYQHSAFLIAWIWGATVVSVFLWNRYGEMYADKLKIKQVEKSITKKR
ncbi:MAG: hypothetical protein JWO44_1094 [Bacteroidetes bacterium]|nr:hypothetical protein [Bacteroidota bacterium]